VLDKDRRDFVDDVGMGSVQHRSSAGGPPPAIGAQIIFSIAFTGLYIYILYICACVRARV
jgi:hypothetical protein